MKNTLPLFSVFVSLRSAASVFSVSPYKHYFYRTACTLCGLRGCLPTFKRQSKQLFLPFPIAQILSARWISSVGLKHISKLKRRLPLARLAVVTVNRFSVGRIVFLQKMKQNTKKKKRRGRLCQSKRVQRTTGSWVLSEYVPKCFESKCSIIQVVVHESRLDFIVVIWLFLLKVYCQLTSTFGDLKKTQCTNPAEKNQVFASRFLSCSSPYAQAMCNACDY